MQDYYFANSSLHETWEKVWMFWIHKILKLDQSSVSLLLKSKI